ncbi:RHS repeat domain-containing protein [Chryseobacterium indologenes]|uniref:RHS repeat domain-containing protein n=1 Tax=Chryseobacterium indologenes TaxID=253 RepID=UPI003C6D4572
MKVRKVFGTETTDYLDGFQYTDSVLKFFPTAEGYFNVETGKYVYNYTDHLGNTRLSYAKNGAGTEIIEESNYYTFGLKHEGYNVLTGNPAYKYKYNGKELQESGMYDYGARFYMPDIGRWGVVDPLAEKHYELNPMMYAANNPIMMIDPDGRDWTITETYDKKTNTTNYHLVFTGAVLNSSSNKKIDMKKFANIVQSQTEAMFSKVSNNPNVTISSSINIRAIEDEKDLKNTDTLIEIKNSDSEDFKVYKKGEVVARQMNGKEVSVNEKYVGDIMSGKNDKTMPHELGHIGGFQHPDQQSSGGFFDIFTGWDISSSNFMMRGAIKNPTGPTPSQIKRMNRLYKAGRLNNKNIIPSEQR